MTEIKTEILGNRWIPKKYTGLKSRISWIEIICANNELLSDLVPLVHAGLGVKFLSDYVY